MKHLFRPFVYLDKKNFLILFLAEIVIAMSLWAQFKSELFPTPWMVLKAFLNLLSSRSFYNDLLVSTTLTFTGMGIASMIALIVGYTYLIPVMKPITNSIVFFRFIPLTGLLFFFTVLSSNGHQLKLTLLIFGIVPFFVTSLKEQMDAISTQEFELCKTLRMNNWQAWIEIVVIGRRDYVLLAMKQNLAISWLMITMVEGLNRSEGGFGVYLNDSNKFRPLADVLALLLVLFILGISFDGGLGKVRELIFPYVKLKTLK